MIISVSRRTDIPALFVTWFIERVKQGYFDAVNPFDGRRVKRHSLLLKDVELFVFWSKNPRPLLPYLDELDARGYRYYFQFTLNDYPALFEPGIPRLRERLDTFVELSSKIGPDRVLWRYDPIIISNETPVEYHIERFSSLASALKGFTRRVTISFLDFYAKTRSRLTRLEARTGLRFEDITAPDHRTQLLSLCKEIYSAANGRGMEVYTCGEALDLKELGISCGACVDPSLIERLTGHSVVPSKDPYQRKECLCAPSTDMGTYNTCSHGCVYCYANSDARIIARHLALHDPTSPSLVRRPSG